MKKRTSKLFSPTGRKLSAVLGGGSTSPAAAAADNPSSPTVAASSLLAPQPSPSQGSSSPAAGSSPSASYSMTGPPSNDPKGTLGKHLARRLVEVGVRDVFSVPGDFNLILLDYLIADPGLNVVGCCNELNAGYAADGYARINGVGCCVVTFTVGGLSVINAIAGAYSENLPVICVVGGPNSNDFGTNRILHHTIGIPDFSQEFRCFQQVTCAQAVVQHIDDAHELIDYAIATALKESKPVYISISCNLPAIPHASFNREPVPYALHKRQSNPASLEAAIEATAEVLNAAVKPVLVGGPKLRVAKAGAAFEELANASGYALASMPSAKGQVSETHEHYIGTYWGAVSTPFCLEIVESADCYLFAGPIFNDYSSVGYSLLFKKEKAVIVQPDRVTIANGVAFGCCLMKDFLEGLAKKVKRNTTAFDNFKRIYIPGGIVPKAIPGEPLRVNVLFKHIQDMLNENTAVIAETGDSWFNCQKLKLPQGCGYEFQMQYGSIGWSVGATLGYAQAVPNKRVIACIGDGSFQVTAQDVSTMIRQEQKSIIFLINNGGYTIEVEIHDGPYNVIKNWDYTGLVDAIHNGEGKSWTCKVKTEEDLLEAIKQATGDKKDCFCFIECICHKDDTSRELLEWGSRVSAANGRAPNPQ
ncbi:pyruvate decarboxylase 2 [Selaginella moellendorffii]|uniref:pyruvate decarboxylase 2 n=1 Tax=Selaginella moellendorffii TaxID=88036 RepID=UPI000D1C5571|nr:pyruvate decarboxylase 2 [Selaginella moellendorffii]|eukprot:XP_024535521.1 pyruvate decarboxylase 2 [Selaginella moellendorffii]